MKKKKTRAKQEPQAEAHSRRKCKELTAQKKNRKAPTEQIGSDTENAFIINRRRKDSVCTENLQLT